MAGTTHWNNLVIPNSAWTWCKDWKLQGGYEMDVDTYIIHPFGLLMCNFYIPIQLYTCTSVNECHFCSLQVGKEFDALIIDTAAPQGAPTFDTFEDDTIEVCYSGLAISHLVYFNMSKHIHNSSIQPFSMIRLMIVSAPSLHKESIYWLSDNMICVFFGHTGLHFEVSLPW